jgi:SAM-dependent methyltransferase
MPDFLEYRTPAPTARQQLRQWFSEPLGTSLLEMEKSQVSKILSNLFGYHIVQLGCLSETGLLENSRISHKVVMQLAEDGENACRAGLICAGDSLALATDSVDVLVVPHVLEFTLNPHKLLREVERVLIGEGYLVLMGFNPWSLWGMWRLFQAWRDIPPWNGHFYGLFRIRDWLTLLDFEIQQVQRFYFRPPFRKDKLMNRLLFLEQLGKYCWPIFGGVYLIVAKKRVVPLTPIKMRWRDQRKMITSGLAEPSAQSRDSHQ